MPSKGAIKVTSISGQLTVNLTGPTGVTPTVYSDDALTAAVSLPATVASGANTTLYLPSTGTYTLSVRTSAGTEIAADNNTTRLVDVEGPGTVGAYSYDARVLPSVPGDSVHSLGGSATFVQTLGKSNGTDDTAAINAILAAAFYVRALPGENYLISAPLVTKQGGQQLIDMTGATVTEKPGSNCQMLRSYADVNPAATAADGAISSGSNVLTTALASQAVVGQTVIVAAAGGNYAGTSTPGPLVGQVGAVGGGTITLAKLTDGTPANASFTVASAAVTLITRDSNVRVIGGTWDKGANDGTNTGRHVLTLYHVDTQTIAPERILSTNGKYAISLANFTNAKVLHPNFATASDGVHATGPGRYLDVVSPRGTVGDDFVAVGTSDFSTYAVTQGDVWDIVATDLEPTTTPTCMFHVFGGGGYGGGSGIMRGVTVDGVKGNATTNSAPVSIDGNTTGGKLNPLDISGVTVRDLKPDSYGLGPLVGLYAQTIGTILIDDPLMDFSTSGKLAGVQVNSGGTVETIEIRSPRVRQAPPSFPLFRIDLGTVTDYIVTNFKCVFGSSGYLAQLANATSVLTRMFASNGVATGGGGLVQATTSTHTLPTVKAVNVELVSVSAMADVATTTLFDLSNVSMVTPSNLITVRATGKATIRGKGNRLAGTPNIVAGGIVTLLTDEAAFTATAGGLPTIAFQAGAGTGASGSIVGSDKFGGISQTTGTTPAAGAQVIVTFTQTLGTAPRSVQLTPTSAAAVAAGLYISAKSATAFTVSAASAPAGTVTFDYNVVP